MELHSLTVSPGRLARLAMASLLFSLAACSSRPPAEDVGQSQAAVFTNGGFEIGAAGTVPAAPWVLTDNLNPNTPPAPNDGVTIQNPQTLAGLNLAPGGKNLTAIVVSAMGPLTQADQDMGASAALRWPRYGNQCAKINTHSSTAYITGGTNNGRNINTLSQTMTVGAGDVDPSDNQVHIRFVAAPVLEDPGHPANEQPYFFIQVTNLTRGNAVLYSNFNFSNQAGVPWQTCTNANCTGVPAGTTYRYTNWQLIDVAPGSPAINMGDTVELQLIAAGCSPGGHEGELYVDGLGATIPGLFLSGTGPLQANPGTDITYDLTYKNGSAATETGVVIDFTTPPNTTFLSLTPPAGVTCTTPAVGTSGTIVCTFPGPVPAGGTGGMTVTVAIAATTPAGLLACGNYQIGSTQESPLLGNIINTEIGCTADDQCSAGNWCNETVGLCTPTLANGTSLPIDPKHIAPQPVLNGMCNAGAGALVCTSGVCDTDGKCGYLNGDGTCAGTPAPRCRSNVCDPDLKCGYAANDGPCVPGPTGNGGVVCRAGLTCSSSSDVCEPAGGCDVDADCTAGNWCQESTHTCTPKEGNGVLVPTDPPHTSPTLDGTCTPANEGQVGPLTCISGVCDTNDNECGYATGDGPCSPATGPVVCRSATCSVTGICVPMGGCGADADCIAADYCNTVSFTCVPKLPNGAPIPTVGNHTPVLNGTCTTGAAASVCLSGVCDTDNDCGYLNGDGPCAAGSPAPQCRSNVCDLDLLCGYASNDGPCTPGALGNGGVVCRSAMCSVSDLCEPAGGCDVDADCAAGLWCFESMHTCTPTLGNGQPIPNDGTHTDNGTCDVSSGAIVCTSGVCDTDNACGYANGDGPCAGTGTPADCRSGTCSTSGTCEPPGGCNVDADCTTGNWCNEAAHMCTPLLVNGTPIPTDPMNGTHLNGMCTPASGLIVCLSGVCDPKDNKCGLADGDGSCTGNPGACRSGPCSATGICGCALDTDCTAGNWCFEMTSTCTPQLANGDPIPDDGTHTDGGMCDLASGMIVCQSGVCDTHDQECGYANGDGPCTPSTSSTECRSGVCGASMLCIASAGCAADVDCPTGKWCDVNASNPTLNACVVKLPNGTLVPNDPGHTSPTLTGTCSAAVGTATCVSGVCDTKDNECGYANGDGTCSATSGSIVCRSGICATSGPNQGVCEACVEDSQCAATAPHCNLTTNACTQCTTSAQCSGSTPICDPMRSLCVACSADHGSSSADACPAASPFCFLAGPMTGECGKCTTNADCQDQTGNVCDKATGLCVTGCLVNSDCNTAKDWCNATPPAPGICVPKLANGTPLPTTPTEDSTCTTSVGKAVCVSGVCDPKDKTCGLANGDGPCANANQCRDDMCDTATTTCGPTATCTKDSECPTGDFCGGGACKPQLPMGAACAGNDQCQTDSCIENVCNGTFASGNGLSCSASTAPRSGSGTGAAIFGLAFALAGLARRRRR